MASLRYFICLLVPFVVCALASSPKGKLIVTIKATSQAQVDNLKHAEYSNDELDFWTAPRLGLTDVMLPRTLLASYSKAWTAAGMHVNISHPDVEALIEDVEEQNSRLKLLRIKTQGTTLNHNFYRTYQQYTDDIMLLRNKHSSIMRFDETAKSLARESTIEGRPIHFLELGSKMGSTPVMMLEVNIHAREWITGAADFYMVDWLVTNYGRDKDATFLLDNFHLVIIPVANPDGYEYSRQNKLTRLWRKNRRYIGGMFECHGVDLNRNFNAFWQSSGYCGSESYPGPSARSEPETRAVETIFNHFQQNMQAYLAVHAYSQLLLLPWSYKTSSTPVNSWHNEVGHAMANAMFTATSDGLQYKVGTAYSSIGYNAFGSSGDWALVRKLSSNARFLSIAYELRPHSGFGSGGFVLTADQIEPTGKELLASVLAAARKVHADMIG